MYNVGSGNPELSHLPLAAVTDCHKWGGLKQQKFISYSDKFTGNVNPCHQEALPGGPRGGSVLVF